MPALNKDTSKQIPLHKLWSYWNAFGSILLNIIIISLNFIFRSIFQESDYKNISNHIQHSIKEEFFPVDLNTTLKHLIPLKFI